MRGKRNETQQGTNIGLCFQDQDPQDIQDVQDQICLGLVCRVCPVSPGPEQGVNISTSLTGFRTQTDPSIPVIPIE